VAALIKDKTGIDTELLVGGRGEFTVWVNGTQVAAKDRNGFPEDDHVLKAVQTSLTKTS
jgi:hypothetical protein